MLFVIIHSTKFIHYGYYSLNIQFSLKITINSIPEYKLAYSTVYCSIIPTQNCTLLSFIWINDENNHFAVNLHCAHFTNKCGRFWNVRTFLLYGINIIESTNCTFISIQNTRFNYKITFKWVYTHRIVW